ncbi:hypothetical protein G9A89_015360 [Geosiphon pyriformis]|nr:hypothetical protein G9A89_015360 [Geosiphon pyriformis]
MNYIPKNTDQISTRLTSLVASSFDGSESETTLRLIDGQAQQVVLKDKSKKVCTDIELYTRQLINDSSLELYHLSEHIRKRVPQFVDEKKNFIDLTKGLDSALSDVTDAREIVEKVSQLHEFERMKHLLKHSIDIIKKK